MGDLQTPRGRDSEENRKWQDEIRARANRSLGILGEGAIYRADGKFLNIHRHPVRGYES